MMPNFKTGAVLPARQPDERPDAIDGLWPQVFYPTLQAKIMEMEVSK